MKIRTYNQLKEEFCNYAPREFAVSQEDAFRVMRIYYDENKGELMVFCNVRTVGRLMQFYFVMKMDLYSYKQCHDTHIFATCRNRCLSYNTFVAPGVKDLHMDKINVIKFKRNGSSYAEKAAALDKFLSNANRVHMQTPVVEGAYMRFRRAQRCRNNCVADDARPFALERFAEDFELVDPASLAASIAPVMACYDIETHSDGHNSSKPDADVIMCIGLALQKNDCFSKVCFVYHKEPLEFPQTNDDTHVVVFRDETEMITCFFDFLRVTNPDVILDYNGDVFDLPYIRARLKGSKPTLRRYDLPALQPNTKLFITKIGNRTDTYYFNYYVHIDLYKYFGADANKRDVENFQLNTLSKYYLGDAKVDLEWQTMVRMYNDKQLDTIIEYNVQDCMLPIRLFNKLKLNDFMYSQCLMYRLCTDDFICNISHLISSTFFHLALTNTRAGSDELDPYFFNKDDLSIISGGKRLQRKLVPLSDVPVGAICLGAIGAAVKYEGGKVLQPRAGVYEYAFSLDFNSLYLTIMIDICACLTNLILCEDGNMYLNQDKNAINVKLLLKLLKQRSELKQCRDNQTESEFLYDLYDQMQNLSKRTANSIYGYYGIFCKALANYITKVGREKLTAAIGIIEGLSDDPELLREFGLSTLAFKVLYGDTDSTFVLPVFKRDEVPAERRMATLTRICAAVEARVNAQFTNGYKMAFENLMSVLVLLKKKKYCYINNNNKVVFKGWLVKKDMPVFMRVAFRSAIEHVLRRQDLRGCLNSLRSDMLMYLDAFGNDKPLTDYSFSMTYNDAAGKADAAAPKRRAAEADDEPPAKRRVVTIARHCREILVSRGTDFVPGNGDRIPYLLLDKQGSVTQKAHPLRLFNPRTMRVSWLKHMTILNSFMNELLEIYGDEHKDELAECYNAILERYMQHQAHDKKRALLVKINERKRKAGASEDEPEPKCANNTYKFCLYKNK
ncbi:DNA polymerase [Samia cynthia nucleopolyhedrovirus]|uniref:DNA polymerase n=2 Tax=Antheraea pernyi nuclear polyhedrosis virus TaxID=161494 RepID=A0A2Z6C630_NPVAP|nr:DNA polymerase [Antheraea yamamai nucleopolyhedrovirus]BBD50696.1 DNA polymerase [Samia cynthia nucleopolyhedrovirus]BBD50849.1 DNA polymerase [Antheraea proylei nucleopolyhedrovirus]BBD51003.1 DNA polymerase [Antheraea pernyi nucleopolyhedrovirus]